MSAPPTNCSFGICLPLMGSLLAALPLMAEIPFAAAVIRDGSRYLLQVPARPGELYCLEVPDVPGSMSFTSVPGTAVYAQSSTVSWPLELPGTVVLDQSAGTPSGEEPPAVGGSTLLVLTVEVADPPGSHVRLRAGGANPWTAVAPAAFPRVTFDGFADLPTANGVRCTALSARTLPEPIGESEPGRAQLSPEQQQEFDAVMAGFPQLIAAATLPPGLPPASGTPPTSPLTSSRYFRVAMYRVDTNGNGYADADELAIGSNPFARPGEPGFLPAASSADGTATPGIAPIWDTDGDFSPDFEEIAAGTSPLLKYSAPVVLTCQKLDRWAIFDSSGSWREYEERFHGWEPGWRNPIHPEMLSGSPISMDPATTPRTLSGFMSDFAAGWSEFDVPSPDARKGLPPQSLFGEYWKLPPLIARSVSPGAGNPPATNGYIRAIGDRYRLRGPLSQVTQQRQFIKATWTQTEGFNQSHVPEYAAETLMEQPPASTEVITLTIPAGALYSPPYDVTPDAPDTPHTNVSDYLKVVRLLPIEVVELSPKVKDEDNNDIAGSEKPSSGKPLTPFVEVDPNANKIAHREIKVKIGDAMKDKKVTWTLEAIPGATPATIRGDWDDSPTHKDRFEASTAYGANGFRKVSQSSGETTVGADGHTAIRVNVPPIGFNQVRIKIQIEGMSTPMNLIDMEVPGVVVIDPGHGGNDSGAVGRTDNTVLEKDLALAYSLNLRQELIDKFKDEDHGIRIVMTRKTTGEFLELADRARKARDNGADVLVSIHFNSATSASARGTETFVERTAAEASAGNPGDNKNVDEDLALATALNTTTLNAVTASDAGALNRGVKREGKAVTRDGATYNGNTQDYHPVKACLIEVEFLSHETALESVKLSNATGTAIKSAFSENAANDIFTNIRNQQ